MVLEDINVARPRYLQWTLFRDYHYAVFNERGEMVAILVMTKGTLRSYWVSQLDTKTQNVVYENHEIHARMMACRYIRESEDLVAKLEAEQPPGQYFLSVVDASGKRLYSISIWI